MRTMLRKLNASTPIQEIDLAKDRNIHLSIKREDLNHPLVQGNKWNKLKYNLATYQEGDYNGIISFGGVFSNHVYAVAAACAELKIPCTLFLRAHQLDEANPTVKHLRDCEVQIKLLDYQAYRDKAEATFLTQLSIDYPKHLVIPEGGSNELAIRGVKELGEQILTQMEAPDYLCVSAGTGATAAGLILAFANEKTKVLVFSSLKGDFLNGDIAKWLDNEPFGLITDHHFGGYAKFNSELIQFINSFYKNYQIPLDPVYTGKMMYGICKMIEADYFARGSSILAIHTGGLQGVEGYNYLNAKKYGQIELASEI